MESNKITIETRLLKQLHQINSVTNLTHGIAILIIYAFLSILGFRINNIFAWIPIWLYQGFILSGFLGASHDCAHRTFVKGKILNRLLGIFWSSTVLFNFSLYKYYHLNHHRNTHVAGDTEPYGSFRNISDYMRTLPMTGFFVPFWKMSILAPFNWFPTFIKTGKHRRHVQQDNLGLLLWLILLTCVTIFKPIVVMKIYIIPILIYFPMVFFTSIPEHYDCDEGSDLTLNTRTLESNALFKYIFWNGNYHAEHHLFPSVPSHNLNKLHQIVGHNFKVHEKSYFSFHIKMLKGIIKSKRDSSNIIFEPEERIIYKFYKIKQ